MNADPQTLMLVLVLFGILAGAGASAGTVLSGTVNANMATAVDSAVIVPTERFNATNVSNQGSVVTVSDDGSRFFVGTEVFQGEEYTIDLPVENRGQTDLAIVLELNQVTGESELEISVQPDETSDIDAVVTSNGGQFVFILKADSTETLEITVSVPDDSSESFNRVEGTIKPVGDLA